MNRLGWGVKGTGEETGWGGIVRMYPSRNVADNLFLLQSKHD